MNGIQIILAFQFCFLTSVNGCCWTDDACYSCLRVYPDTSGPNLLVADLKRIYVMNLNDRKITMIVVMVKEQRNFPQIDYHRTRSLIYWADSTYATIHRTCYPCDSNERQIEDILPKSSKYRPHSVAVDSEHDHIYWSERNYKAVFRSELDGTNEVEIINSSAEIGYITLDVNNDWMYYMDNENGTINRCTLNGKNRTTIISDADMTMDTRILLDFVRKRIYWTAGDMIRSASFDGSDLKEIQGAWSYKLSSYSVTSIAVYGEYLYSSTDWTSSNNVYRIKENGTYHNDKARVQYIIRDMQIYHGSIMKDPCVEYTKLERSEKRSTSEDPITDDILEEGWYRVYSDNGDAMPTAPPGTTYCGTTNPFWLNGTMPEFADGNMTVEVCMQTTLSVCEESVNIVIRNCDGYFVYYLRPTPANSSYCFGSGPEKCPDGMSSETGYDPGCSSNFPTDSVSLKVKAMLTEVETVPESNYDQTPSSIPIFKCEFEDHSNGTYGYDVYWLISGDVIKINKHLLFEDITDSIGLNATEWHGKYKMNMEVKCAIRMRNSKQSTPGPYMYSPIFKAGLYPDSYSFTVNEGESINITFTSSVPVGCNGSNCDLNFYIRQWAGASSCTNGIVNRDILIKAEFCGINLRNSTWMEKKTLQVYGYNDGLYNTNNRFADINIYTSSVSKSHAIWEDVYIEPIRVTVKDKDIVLINRLCQSYNDPHFRTFDGKHYDYMGVGEFVLYKNDIGPYVVHALFTSCGFGIPGASCLCGIAIRSKCSLFVLRTCEKISRREKHLLQQPVVSLTSCDKNDMTVIHTNDDYKIILPIATEIRFSIARRFISVISIKPSVVDINTAKGLCGVPSTTPDPSDDFTLRGNGQVTDEQIFADSWKITAGMIEEQLFVTEPDFLKTCNDSHDPIVPVDNNANIPNLVTFCACEQQHDSSHSPNGHCNLTQINEQCSESQSSSSAYVHYTRCPQSQRRRRAVDSSNKKILSDNDDFVDFHPLTYSNDVNDTHTEPPQTFRNGWTSERAYNICTHNISEALQNDMYKVYVDVPDEKFIEACVKDIEIAGDTTFLTDTIHTIATSVMTELVKTENLYTKKSSDGSQTLLEYFSSTLCKNNCSNNGICKSGVCKCASGFIGDDCSFDISKPPTDVILPLNGACKLRSRSCKTTNIFGEFLSTSVWCKRRHFEILQNDVLYTSGEDIVLATYRNSFMITLDIPAARKKRSTDNAILSDGYDISLSYDGQNFGEEIRIIIYDDLQYSCNATTQTCITLIVEEYSEKNETTKDTKDVMMIVIPITVSVVVIVVIAGVVCFKLKAKFSRKKIAAYKDEPDHKVTPSNNWKGQHSTSTIDFQCAEDTGVDSVAEQYPTQKENVDI